MNTWSVAGSYRDVDCSGFGSCCRISYQWHHLKYTRTIISSFWVVQNRLDLSFSIWSISRRCFSSLWPAVCLSLCTSAVSRPPHVCLFCHLRASCHSTRLSLPFLAPVTVRVLHSTSKGVISGLIHNCEGCVQFPHFISPSTSFP